MKKRMKRFVSIAICLTMVVVFAIAGTACGSGDKDKGALLATAGDVKYYENATKEFAKFYFLWYYGKTIDELDEATQTQLIDNTALNMLVDYQVIRDYMGDKDVITDDQRKEIDNAIESFLNPPSGSETELTNIIKQIGTTKETMTTFFDFMYYQQAFREKINAETPVTEDQIKTYYEAHEAEYIAPDTINLSHILMGSPELTDEDRAAAQAVLDEINAGGDFAALAKEHSLDTGSKESGGELGDVPKGEMVEPFETAGFALKNGEVSGIVESEFGFHIIKANGDLVPEHQQTLEEATEAVTQAIQNENLVNLIDELRGKIKITYDKGVDPNAATAPVEDTAPAEDTEPTDDSEPTE